MIYSKIILSFVLISTLCVGYSYSAVIEGKPCTKTASERAVNSEVHEIDVSPCPLAPNGPCECAVGNNMTITIRFTPFSKIGRRARDAYLWEKNPVDLPFKGIPTQLCKKTDCSLDANVERTYTAILPIKRSLPKSTYPVKVKLYEGSKVFVCKIIDVKLF